MLYLSYMEGKQKRFVAYYRVSTRRQGESGLGLEAQKRTVLSRISQEGAVLVSEFVEVESGRKRDRKELALAVEECRREGAVLLIAKLDRLSRDVEFLFSIRNSGVEFVAADLPELNTLTLALFAAFAQHEAERISQRTKEALDAKKEREGGKEWRVSNLDEDSRKRGVESIKRKAAENPNNKRALSTLRLIIQGARDKGEKRPSLQFLSEYLNEEGFTTSTGKQFTKTQVSRLLKKL